jgi:uncharacterized delta-60 repeat protein/uncharacterized repeat protein (TIGR01451 family)
MFINQKKCCLICILSLIIILTLPTMAQTDSPGELDVSFGVNGKVTTDVGANDNGYALTLQPDGKVIVAGWSGSRFGLARYNTNGSLDTSFDTDGKVATVFGSNDRGHDVVVQDDGKIVVVGESDNNFALARYNSDGSLDTSFGVGGKVTTDFGSSDNGWAAILQADNKIVVAGRSDNNFALARYNSDGNLDTSFGVDGKVITDFGSSNDIAQAVALLSDGKFVVAGQSNFSFALARYNSDGSLDTSFGTAGKVFTAGFNSGSDDMVIQPDGKIVLVGNSGDIAMVRYNSDGSLDTSFGTDGKVIIDFGSTEFGNGVAILPNGKLVFVGTTLNADIVLIRLNSDGSLDSSFDTDGKIVTDFGSYDYGEDVLLQTDGKIVVSGESGSDFALVRYLGDPILDLRKKVSDDMPSPNQTITYTITISNNGSTNAAGVVVSDTLPSYIDGSDFCQTVDITANTSLTFTLNVTLSNSAPFGEIITNTAFFSHTSGNGQDNIAFVVGKTNPDDTTNIYLPIILKFEN